MTAHKHDLKRLLKEWFGYEEFRLGQEQIARDLLSGRDVVAVLPTGAGKSLPFQLASLILPGLTIVVSPLLSLMKDQVDSLDVQGPGAGAINSGQSRLESSEVMEMVHGTAIKLLYVTPERFNDAGFMEKIKRARVSLLVVDEAHCISEWGYDFRPGYLKLGQVIQALGRPTILALTATATPRIRQDIMERLGMKDPDIVVRSVDRPNLFMEVRRVMTQDEEMHVLKRLFEDAPVEYGPELGAHLRETMQGAGIIYTATTRGARETATALRAWGIAADYYHGQRKKTDRDRVQEAFMAGELRVIAATNAFGMGVDKQDISFVIHRDIPGSLEQYYQEAGRAGRDGRLGRCTLLFREASLGRAAFRSASSRLTPQDVVRARELLCSGEARTSTELAGGTGLGPARVARLLSLLVRAEIAEERDGEIALVRPDFDANEISLQSEETHRAFEQSRVQMMRRYANARACRRVFILNYFGQDPGIESCNLCDNDTAVRSSISIEKSNEDPDVPDTPDPMPEALFRMGDQVNHRAFGAGAVERITADLVTILFEEVGYKTLALDGLVERGLLRLVDREQAPALSSWRADRCKKCSHS